MKLEELYHFYPKGITKDDSNFRTSKEYLRLSKKIFVEVHQIGQLYSEWKEFLRRLGKEYDLVIVDRTNGQAPSLMAEVNLPLNAGNHKYEFWLFQSLLVNVFTFRGRVYSNGIDRADATSVDLLVSPAGYYKKLIDSLIVETSRFQVGSTFMNYSDSQKIIPGIQVPHSDDADINLFQACFYREFDCVRDVLGDQDYQINNE